MIRISPGCYILAALLVLILPLSWILAAVLAAIFHELCHLVSIVLLGGSIREIRVGLGGAEIEAELEGNVREILCSAAGPIGSLSLLLFCRIWPQLALCGLIQGSYNLLPVYPLDGGRVLLCLLQMRFPKQAQYVMKWIKRILYVAIIAFITVISFDFSCGITLMIPAALLIMKGIMRKRPCKAERIGVQ